MGPVYLIYKSIYFYPKEHRLVCHSQGKEDTTLTQPAAKCLELLVKTDGLVSQNNLYDYAWGENSHSVTPNTLYQNISLIRRALKNIMPGADRWIITVPRKGFRFDHSISTRLLAAEETLPVTAEDTLPAVAPAQLLNPERIARAKPLRSFISVSLVVLFFSLTFFINPVSAEFKKLTGSYDKIAEDGTCQLYVYRNDQPLKEQINSRVNKYVNCDTHPHIYISYDKFIKNISLFSCQDPLTENSTSCASWSLGETI
ncbi:hypothetical protein COO59_09745 [Mixta theicola]|uniref:OmpR/PhoB-type domain-containing protein n=1 Tax=Mixta theicola TaxID=1458355 RepID=A0A2K1Q9R0_9GAMM|nr:winged helix-turn-helix domain-containing protein [Mixta theicola]PNS11773.1 hypothetical protein COO59_09745 [Mixta theicola]GLR07690.1 transcriptional regulator [Mixta theicola]